jgi:hypothetical protein
MRKRRLPVKTEAAATGRYCPKTCASPLAGRPNSKNNTECSGKTEPAAESAKNGPVLAEISPLGVLEKPRGLHRARPS